MAEQKTDARNRTLPALERQMIAGPMPAPKPQKQHNAGIWSEERQRELDLLIATLSAALAFCAGIAAFFLI
ncbi:hypothetical protein BI364_06885 [Acidihalobacter yilgarnensis]|uniref:Uncharacterized protein n=1 Tax=Acidihalobacter yilgarnensis TaxID=2819280 RepID=A0A1D8IMM9_9GAMM|nr:hypothetical protein [Acidihalobacter yilgarnensis]AOU97719.1 hypothetical protein BI364_06885 [Acidihalobacter yilgarnensis]